MRVLHVYSGNLWGGIERFLVTLAKYRQADPAVEHRFALCFEGELARQLRTTGAEVALLGEVRLRKPWTVVQARKRLGEVVARVGAKVLVLHSFWPWALFASARVPDGVRKVLYLHDAARGGQWPERVSALFRPDRMVANSRYTAETVMRLFPRGPRPEVVHYPVEPAPGGVGDGSERARTRESLGIREDEVLLVQASRMEPWKGHPLLIDALARIHSQSPFQCLLVGGAQRPHEQRYVAELEAQVARRGLSDRVRFLGHRSDVGRILAAADLMVQPNALPEPFGIVIVEALWAGLPVVTANVGGAAEIVDDRCGRTVPRDAEALAQALAQLIDDHPARSKLAAAARERARELCDPEARVRSLGSVLGAAA